MIKLVEGVLKKENLKAKRIKAIKLTKGNLIFQADDKYIIRIKEGKEGCRKLKFKAELIRMIEKEIPVANVVAFDRYEGVSYLIQKYIAGQTLFQTWPRLTPVYREKLIANLVSFLNNLHAHEAPKFGIPYDSGLQFESWQEFCCFRFEKLISEISSLPASRTAEPVLGLVARYFKKHKHYLKSEKAVLLHGDLWPANILVRGHEIRAIIDFEFALWGPPDYEFFLTLQFCLFPSEAGGEKRYLPENFRDYWQLLRKYYPKAFSFPRIDERLNLYLILHNLGLYKVSLEGRKSNKFNSFSIDPLLKILIFLFDPGAKLYFWT